MKILFFGSDDFAIPSLHALAQSQHSIVAVVTQPDKPAGRGRNVTACPLALVAREMGLPLLKPPKIRGEEVVRQLLALQPEALVVVAYGKFLPQSLIDAVPFKAVNVHPSLLPKYRGASPIQSAILNGDKTAGVTTMTISPEMDAGDIYLQCETAVDEVETAQALGQRLGILGAELLLKTLEELEKGNLKPKPQDPEKVVATRKLEKEEGRLQWKESAITLHNRVRALNPWPGTFCYWESKRLKVFETAVINTSERCKPGTLLEGQGSLTVACGRDALCLLEVQLEGKKRMSATEFIRGHRVPVGTQLK